MFLEEKYNNDKELGMNRILKYLILLLPFLLFLLFILWFRPKKRNFEYKDINRNFGEYKLDVKEEQKLEIDYGFSPNTKEKVKISQKVMEEMYQQFLAWLKKKDEELAIVKVENGDLIKRNKRLEEDLDFYKKKYELYNPRYKSSSKGSDESSYGVNEQLGTIQSGFDIV